MALPIPPKLLQWWRLWKVPAVAAVLLLVAWSARGPVLRVAADWRASRTAAQAAELAAAGQWREAEVEARRALQLDRRDHRALGVLMESALRNGHPETLRIAASYFAHPESSPTDKAKVLELLLFTRDHIGFRRLQSSLSPELRQEPEIALQTIRFLSIRGGHAEALRQLETYRAATGVEDERFELLAADLRIRSGQHAEAVKTIGALVHEGGATGSAAFRMLDRFPLDALRTLPVGEILDRHEEESPLSAADSLVAATIRYAQAPDPVEAGSVIASTVSLHQETSLEALCQWLNRIDRSHEIVPLVSTEMAMNSSTLAALRLQSHIVAGDFDEAERWLGEIERVFDAARAYSTRAVLAARQGRRAEALRYWRSGIGEAEIRNDGNLYLRMGQMALEFREWDWAVEAILKASAYPESLLSSGTEFTVLIDYLLRGDRLDEARRLVGLWVAREPESPSLRNNYIYLDLLAGNPAQSLLPQIESLATTFPGMTGFQTTHALALALAGDLGGALAILERPSIDWTRASSSDRAILDLLRRKQHAPGSAAAALAALSLYPAERRLLEAYLAGRHQGTGTPAAEAPDSVSLEP